MKYVLDTNIVTRLLKGDERVLSHLADVEPNDVGIPLLVLAELLFGAEKSVRKEQNGARIKQMTETFRCCRWALPLFADTPLSVHGSNAVVGRRATLI